MAELAHSSDLLFTNLVAHAVEPISIGPSIAREKRLLATQRPDDPMSQTTSFRVLYVPTIHP